MRALDGEWKETPVQQHELKSNSVRKTDKGLEKVTYRREVPVPQAVSDPRRGKYSEVAVYREGRCRVAGPAHPSQQGCGDHTGRPSGAAGAMTRWAGDPDSVKPTA